MVFCFGELLLRMSPSLHREWIREHVMPVYIGGAELNVATALAAWQIPVRYCTALPANYLSEEIRDEITEKKIDTSAILFSGDRIGTYYLPQGTDLKNAGVIYDRAYSSFASLQPGKIDWDKILEGCSWFHFSAISPALNENIAAICLEGIIAAKKKGLKISVDLNYRSKLWKYGKDPKVVMPALVAHCDVVMGNIWSAHDLLGIKLDEGIHDQQNHDAYTTHARETAMAIMSAYPACRTVANTFRFDKENGIYYYATLDSREGQLISPDFIVTNVADKIGSGDCFMAGLIYGFIKNNPQQDIIDFAAAAAIGKLQEHGDATKQTEAEVKKLIKENGKRIIHH
jgi:2-dehydro-3-deoxygluconokinase